MEDSVELEVEVYTFVSNGYASMGKVKKKTEILCVDGMKSAVILTDFVVYDEKTGNIAKRHGKNTEHIKYTDIEGVDIVKVKLEELESSEVMIAYMRGDKFKIRNKEDLIVKWASQYFGKISFKE